MDIKFYFGQAVREYRLKRKLSQEQLAELADLHRSYISDVERGAKNISLISIDKVCKALKIKMSDLCAMMEKLQR